jgi:hypothetical protein
MDGQFDEFKERLIKLEVLQEKDIKEADEWRVRFCSKMDKLTDKIDSLPCDKREGRWLSQGVQIKWLWIAITFMTGIVGWFVITFLTHLTKLL